MTDEIPDEMNCTTTDPMYPRYEAYSFKEPPEGFNNRSSTVEYRSVGGNNNALSAFHKKDYALVTVDCFDKKYGVYFRDTGMAEPLVVPWVPPAKAKEIGKLLLKTLAGGTIDENDGLIIEDIEKYLRNKEPDAEIQAPPPVVAPKKEDGPSATIR